MRSMPSKPPSSRSKTIRFSTPVPARRSTASVKSRWTRQSWKARLLRAGAVAAYPGIKNPIRLARRIMERPSYNACRRRRADLRAEIGFRECAPESLIVESERQRWKSKHGTVGCVAFDEQAKLAVATSTGGIFNKLPGRIGDSPLIGCGTYANASGAVSCTGYGEAIIRVVLAKSASII